MGPKGKKKSKAELEEEQRLADIAQAKLDADAKVKAAQDAEKKRIEDLRIMAENRVKREAESNRLGLEYNAYLERLRDRNHQRAAEFASEVSGFFIISVFNIYIYNFYLFLFFDAQ